MTHPIEHQRLLTAAAALAAVAVVADAVMVGAPGLAILAAPLVAGLVLLRSHRAAALVTLAAGGALFTAIAVNYAVAAGAGDWPAGDVVGILVGGPAAAVTAAVAVTGLAHRRRHHPLT